MSNSLLISLAAMLALLPAGMLPLMQPAAGDARDGRYWALIAVAVAGPALWVIIHLGRVWHTGLAAALWLSITVSVVLFAGLALVNRVAWRLTPLLIGYLFLLAVLATIWQHAPERPLSGAVPAVWLQLHILVSIVAYGLLTLAAVAGTGVFVQERALKNKRPNAFTRHLPSVAEGEALQARLLGASAAVLTVALASGMAITWLERRALLRLDHKTVLSLMTFAVIVALLWVHQRGGLSGRRSARYVLLAYLLLTLAYPGVKFVTDVIIG
ncbi:MAG: cytochrome c biogenesis protein CcsA [Rhodospirillales bacterium]|nr:cytochrome c biogenesis protein CcsA [Rhodospirillales bacterium]